VTRRQVNLPDDLWKDIKVAAVQGEVSPSELIRLYMVDALYGTRKVRVGKIELRPKVELDPLHGKGGE